LSYDTPEMHRIIYANTRADLRVMEDYEIVKDFSLTLNVELISYQEYFELAY
jgi:surfactin synthase thioesterase subunit